MSRLSLGEVSTTLRFSSPSSIFNPGKIGVAAFAADWLTVNEYDSGEGLAILPNYKNELQAVPESAILYEIDLFSHSYGPRA